MSSATLRHRIGRHRVDRLTPETIPAFQGMTFPSYRHLLDLTPAVRHHDEGGQPIEPLALGAYDANGAPVGLALSELPTTAGVAPTLLSVYVVPDQRRQGIAGRLVEATKLAVGLAGFDQLDAVYMTGKPGAEIFEHLTQRQGWSAPVPRMITLKSTFDQALAMPWCKRYPPRAGFEIVPWTAVTDDEQATLREEQARDAWIPSDLVPWNFDHRGFDASSVAARDHGRVVGWVLTHRIQPQTVRFTCSFMHSDLARAGMVVPLYAESIHRLTGTGVTRCLFTTPMHFPAMVAFVRRRIAPYASALAETRGVTTTIGRTT